MTSSQSTWHNLANNMHEKVKLSYKIKHDTFSNIFMKNQMFPLPLLLIHLCTFSFSVITRRTFIPNNKFVIFAIF